MLLKDHEVVDEEPHGPGPQPPNPLAGVEVLPEQLHEQQLLRPLNQSDKNHLEQLLFLFDRRRHSEQPRPCLRQQE